MTRVPGGDRVRISATGPEADATLDSIEDAFSED
ncbi:MULTISPECIES: HPr family phosphocarrier protein [Natrialbaceae]